MKDEYYNIPPIETFYDGYDFRSRLEARWAIYFNVLGVRYNYEPVYFSLPSSASRRIYTPDFWIDDEYSKTNFLLEIKPKYPQKEAIELMEYVFASEDYKTRCIILYGEEIPAPAQHIEEFGFSAEMGYIDFDYFFDKDEEVSLPDTQEVFNTFLTFDRNMEEVNEALEAARNFDFCYT